MDKLKESPLRRFMVSEDTVPLESPTEERDTNYPETYMIYKHTGTELREEIRSAQELTTDKYYEFVEDDRIVPKAD